MNLEGFEFELADVPVETTEQVDAKIGEGRSVCVSGRWGSGRTYAVQQTQAARDPKSVWLDMALGPMQQPRFMVDVARQTVGGAKVLHAYADGQVSEALRLADSELGGRTLIVDHAERLLRGRTTEWDEPAEGIWASARTELREWLYERARRAPTVFISDRPLATDIVSIEHQSPRDWPVRLRYSPGGWRDWRELATDRLKGRPGGLQLAKILVPFLDQVEYDTLLDDLRCDAVDPTDALRIIGRRLGHAIPTHWRQALAVVHALDGLPEACIRGAFADATLQRSLDTLIKVRLVSARGDRLSVLQSAVDAGVLDAIEPAERRPLLIGAARTLCDSVNALNTLDPLAAERVFRAHMLYVQLDEWDEAARTARLHVAGLVELARRRSMGDRFDEARELYGRIEGMLKSQAPHSELSMRRLLSYATHYRAYNARKAGLAGGGEVLDAYREAAALWPENALWHQRLISQSFELGRITEACDAVERAYEEVPSHPKRDTFLRIAPAWSAIDAGVGGVGLALIEPILERGEIRDPDGETRLVQLLQRWERGVEVLLLAHPAGRVVFNQPTLVRVSGAGDRWRAIISRVNVDGRAAGPAAAIERAADALAERALWLLRTPTWQLDEGALRQKSTVIGLIDLLNSDIGLRFESHRWLPGRIEGDRFVPVQDVGVESVELSAALDRVADAHGRSGVYLGRMPVLRDGRPDGPIEALEPVGSGRTLTELLDELRRIGAGGG